MEVGIPDRFGVELVTQDPPILRPQTHRFLGGPTADTRSPSPLRVRELYRTTSMLSGAPSNAPVPS